MRYHGVATCSTVVMMMAVVLALGSLSVHAASQPVTKKPAPAKKRTTTASAARPKKATAASKPQLSAATQPATEAEPADESQPMAEPEAAADSMPAVPPPPAGVETPLAAVASASEPASAELTPVDIPVASAPIESPALPGTPSAAAPEVAVGTATRVASRKISIGQAIVLGIVEGLTEYLPVSSTGHLILAGYWLGLTRETDEPGVLGGHKLEKVPAIDAFDIVIQLGAILAVLGLYRKRVGQMAQGLMRRNEQGLRLVGLLLVAFLPAAVVGLALHKKIEEHLFGPMPVVVALAVGGVLMIVVEHFFWTRRKARIHEATQTRSMMPVGAARSGGSGPVVNVRTPKQASSYFTRVDTMLLWQAVVIGAAQCLALWPGTSRSMITMLAALVVGLDMAAAAEFSFLLALPTLGAATLYSGAKHWHELMASAGAGGLLVGLIVSGIVAAVAVKGFVYWLTHRGLLPFGIYRIVMALVLIVYFLG